MPRIFPTQITRMLLLLVALVVGGTLGYMLIEGWQLRDALFMTVTTLSTVGYGEVHPLSPAGEYFSMLLIFSGVGVLFYAFGVVMDYVVAGELQGVLARQRMARKIATMADHFIVCGFGRMGRQVVEELHANAINVVVVDLDASVAPELAQQKIPFIAGDPSSDESCNGPICSARRACALVCPTTPPTSLSCSARARPTPGCALSRAATNRLTSKSCASPAPTRSSIPTRSPAGGWLPR